MEKHYLDEEPVIREDPNQMLKRLRAEQKKKQQEKEEARRQRRKEKGLNSSDSDESD